MKLIGHSRAMESVRNTVEKIAETDTTVLILGETGTGKDLVASAIHEASRRSAAPFVALNCGSLPHDLVESELFGYDRGAFTGATTAKKGRFEQAHTGTVFLDEIGEISPAVQVKLLRVLQNRVVDHVGGSKPIPVDLRVIAATNKDLEQMVKAGTFREDLYYRLHVKVIRTPALRDRLEDVEELALHFARLYGQAELEQGIAPYVLSLFRQYSWPGNVRELQSAIECAVNNNRFDMIEAKDLERDFYLRLIRSGVGPRSYEKAMEELSLDLCRWALQSARGNLGKAAALLEMNRTTFYRTAKGHGLVDLLEN